MKTLKFLISKTLLYYFWQEFKLRWHFKFVIPKLRELQIEDLRFDVSSISPVARHRLLRVGYETHEKAMCHDFLKPSDSVLEIGAAIGFIGIYCQKKLGIKNYHSVEANPRTIDMLKRNYQLNGLSPNLWNFAIGPRDGQIELNVDCEFWENSIVQMPNPSLGRKTMDVPCLTLQSLLNRLQFQFNVMIIDVEGAEQFIDFDSIPSSVNKIIIELHPKLIGPEKTFAIVAQLISNGFRVVREENATFMFVRSDPLAQEQKESPQLTREPARAGRSSPKSLRLDPEITAAVPSLSS